MPSAIAAVSVIDDDETLLYLNIFVNPPLPPPPGDTAKGGSSRTFSHYVTEKDEMTIRLLLCASRGRCDDLVPRDGNHGKGSCMATSTPASSTYSPASSVCTQEEDSREPTTLPPLPSHRGGTGTSAGREGGEGSSTSAPLSSQAPLPPSHNQRLVDLDALSSRASSLPAPPPLTPYSPSGAAAAFTSLALDHIVQEAWEPVELLPPTYGHHNRVAGDARYLGVIQLTSDLRFRCYAFVSVTRLKVMVVTAGEEETLEDAMIPIMCSICEKATAAMLNPLVPLGQERLVLHHSSLFQKHIDIIRNIL